MNEKKILYVEDDLSLIEGLKYTLEKNGFLVDNARTVMETYQFFRTGFDICKEVRKTSAVPIIFLTASDEGISIVKGLDMGGDDYITKPFKLGEVLSRINALLRRLGQQFHKSDTILESDGIRIDLSERICWKGETEIPLTLVEYKLLCLFLRNPGRILPRELILGRLVAVILPCCPVRFPDTDWIHDWILECHPGFEHLLVAVCAYYTNIKDIFLCKISFASHP